MKRFVRLAPLIAVISIAAAFTCGCEKRVILREEMFFMKQAENNWKKLTPTQKAKYYQMIEQQKERARKEELQKR